MGWRPIATAPKDGSVVLTYRHAQGGHLYEVSHWDDEEALWIYCGDFSISPTHWMPLPDPPKVTP